MRMEKTPPFKGMQKKKSRGRSGRILARFFFFRTSLLEELSPGKKEKFLGRVGSAVLIFPTAATLASSIVQPKFLLSLISSDCLVYGGGTQKDTKYVGEPNPKNFPLLPPSGMNPIAPLKYGISGMEKNLFVGKIRWWESDSSTALRSTPPPKDRRKLGRERKL